MYASCVELSLIADLALAFVKYKLEEPSPISSVSNTTVPVAELKLVTGAVDCV